jgi:AraC-like DNA-binding protein
MDFIKSHPRYLSNYVHFIYSLKSDTLPAESAAYLPDGTLEFIFNPFEKAEFSTNKVNWQKCPGMMITGLFRTCTYYRWNGPVYWIGLVFKPGCAHLFMNDSMPYFQKSMIPADLIYGTKTKLLAEQLLELKNEAARHQLVEHFIHQTFIRRKCRGSFIELESVLKHIHTSGANASITELAQKHNLSTRNLRRAFAERVGMSPKQYSDIVRVKIFLKSTLGKTCSWNQIREELGYTDLSHLNKTFKRIAGSGPSAFFKNQPDLQKKLNLLVV